MGVQPLEQRQQGRVDVDHPALPFGDEPVGQELEIAGEADDVLSLIHI